jgi:hypothetical protein
LISSLPFLDDHDCTRAAAAVEAARAHWRDLHPDRPGQAFTLGKAAYLDAWSDAAAPPYFNDLAESNAVLRDRFAWLYDRLRVTMSAVFGVESVFREDLALPGFHIYLGPWLTHMAGITPHFDLQHLLLPQLHDTGETDVIAFTAPITLPGAGAGLDWWACLPDDCRRGGGSIDACLAEHEARYLGYRRGEMVLHHKPVLHRIAFVPGAAPADTRLTLQGHGALRDGKLVLYW